MKLKVIIIDDEPDAIEVLESIVVNHTSDVQVAATTTDPALGIELILTHEPDFIFLDVEMGSMSGFDLLDCLAGSSSRFKVIFVTAYEHYAIKAIKNNALDYILKPIKVNEVIQAIAKVRELIKADVLYNIADYSAEKHKFPLTTHIKISTLSGIEFIKEEDVVHLDASGSYTLIHLLDGNRMMVSRPLKKVKSLFDSVFFLKIHRSHVINLEYIKRYETDKSIVVMSNGVRIPLSRRCKDKFIERINCKKTI